eukprot:CAMPEP_0195108928 /NCGR_PEP_ID=MMETSP0448-20130528/87373_1 /TAXON_ID=66468 /ORGANISM="Heterocapsa triquestra, Strain CCMP 448" /LENGTH=44 /DNA_ID= /DNA_START= /DNA_END= /DNA_ORIENTATION=
MLAAAAREASGDGMMLRANVSLAEASFLHEHESPSRTKGEAMVE